MNEINIKKEHFSENNLYKNRYRVESARLKNWDYSSNGYYYITVCTKDRIHYFGDIIDDEMILSEIGNMAYQYWQKIPDHFPFVRLDEFVIMPNHVHGIVIIKNDTCNNVETLQCNVSTDNFHSKISPKSKSLSTIIRSYKSICTKTINKIQNKIFFAWQPRFYDHIIRNEKELENTRNYIFDNPQKWMEDDYYK